MDRWNLPASATRAKPPNTCIPGSQCQSEPAKTHPSPFQVLLAMGNDGGSIPTRRELVKEAARNPSAAQVKESQHEQQEYQWTTDPISRQPLVQPVVSDSSGKLYNKATILEYLVEGTRKEDRGQEDGNEEDGDQEGTREDHADRRSPAGPPAPV